MMNLLPWQAGAVKVLLGVSCQDPETAGLLPQQVQQCTGSIAF